MLKLFGKADTWLDVGLRWGGAFGLAWAGLAWLANKMSSLGELNLADAVALGLGGAMLMSAIVSLALIAVRYFRPIGLPAASADSQGASDAANLAYQVGYEWDEIKTAIDELKAFQQTIGVQISENKRLTRAVIDDYQRMDTGEVRFGEKLDQFRAEVSSGLTSLSGELKTVAGEAHRANQLVGRLEDLVEKEKERSAHSFHAIWVREKLENFSALLNHDAADLYDDLASGVKYDAIKWDSWESVNHNWEQNLKQWVNLAKWFAHNVESRILEVAEDEFSGIWKVEDAQFPNADAQRRFKRHRIMMRHWEEIRDDVMEGVRLVAYSGMSERDVQNAAARKIKQQPL